VVHVYNLASCSLGTLVIKGYKSLDDYWNLVQQSQKYQLNNPFVWYVFSAFSDYNKEQFTPARLGSVDEQVMYIIYW
jgi:hypothetical protein